MTSWFKKILGCTNESASEKANIGRLDIWEKHSPETNVFSTGLVVSWWGQKWGGHPQSRWKYRRRSHELVKHGARQYPPSAAQRRERGRRWCPLRGWALEVFGRKHVHFEPNNLSLYKRLSKHSINCVSNRVAAEIRRPEGNSLDSRW